MSNRYIRNLRKKYWMLCGKDESGNIKALADESLISVTMSDSVGILYESPKSPTKYLLDCGNELKKQFDLKELFVVRINSNKCPIEVDFKNEAPRYKKANVYFKVK